MNYTFFEPPSDYNSAHSPILISGGPSKNFNHTEYLIINNALYEIRFEQDSSPFKKAIIIDNFLAVGHQEHFYLFNLTTNKPVLNLKINDYFGNIYTEQNQLFITDSSAIYCITHQGEVAWCNNKLGIDGVTIHKFKDNKIYGSGEWSSSSGWEEFVLDAATGQPVQDI